MSRRVGPASRSGPTVSDPVSTPATERPPVAVGSGDQAQFVQTDPGGRGLDLPGIAGEVDLQLLRGQFLRGQGGGDEERERDTDGARRHAER